MSNLRYTFAVVLGAFLVLALKPTEAQPLGTIMDCPVGQECIIEQVVIGGVVKEQRRVLANGNTVWEALNVATGQFEPIIWVQHTKEISTGDATGRLHFNGFPSFHCEAILGERYAAGYDGCTWIELRIGGTPDNPEGDTQGVGWFGVDRSRNIFYMGTENFYQLAMVTTDLVSPHIPNSTDVLAIFGWDKMRLYQQNGQTRLDINGTATLLRSALTIEAADWKPSLLIRDISGNWRAAWTARRDDGVWKMHERAYNGLIWEQIP